MKVTVLKIKELPAQKDGSTMFAIKLGNTKKTILGVQTALYATFLTREVAEGIEEGKELELPEHEVIEREFTNSEGVPFTAPMIKF